MLRRRKTNHPSILEALYEAQKIAFSPFIFEACVAAKRMGLLAAIDKAQGGEKASEENLAKATNLTLYAVGALADALEAAGVLTREKREGRCRAPSSCFPLPPRKERTHGTDHTKYARPGTPGPDGVSPYEPDL